MGKGGVVKTGPRPFPNDRYLTRLPARRGGKIKQREVKMPKGSLQLNRTDCSNKGGTGARPEVAEGNRTGSFTKKAGRGVVVYK